jgi:hypothetical protein
MRWHPTSVNLIAAVVLATPFPVAAQAPVTPSLSPELHRQFLLMALDSYQRARCEGNQPCAPASAAERATPPITDDQARAIVAAATISTMAEHCQLDWGRRNFVPLMQHHRERLKMSERQMALLGFCMGSQWEQLARQSAGAPARPK